MALTDVINTNEQHNIYNNLIGLDLGYGQVKISSGETNIQFPSIVGNLVSQFTKSAPISSFQELLDTLEIIINGQHYCIGHNAIVNTRNGKISLKQNKIEDIQTKIKVMTALALLTPQNQSINSFEIISGLPILEWSNQKDLLYNMLMNDGKPFEFIMKYGNQSIAKQITCTKCKILAQSEGSFYSWVLDSSGNIIPSRAEYANGLISVVDIGYRTTDIIAMENGRYLQTLSDQINTGVSQIHQEILRLIMQNHNIKKELKDIDTIVRNKEFFYSTKTYNINDIIKQACEPFADNIIENLYTINNGELGNLHMVLLAGGGAELIFDYMKNKLQNVVRVEKVHNAEFSNSQGYYKYGKLLKNNNQF